MRLPGGLRARLSSWTKAARTEVSAPSGRLDLRLLGPALGAWATLAAALGLPVLGSAACSGTLGVAVLVLVRRHRPRAALYLLVPAGLLVALGGHQMFRASGPLADLAAERATVVVEATVSGEPHRVTSPLGGAGEVVVLVDCHGVVGRGELGLCHAPLLLRGGPDLADLRWHATVRAAGRLGPLPTGERALAILTVRGRVLESAAPGPLERAAERVRGGLREASSGLGADARGLLPGLVVGDTSAVPEDLVTAMRASGLTHLTAVSGANVAIVLGLVLWVCRLLGVPRAVRAPGAGVALAAFVVLARPDPSVLRAAAMGLVGLVGLGTGRRTRGPAALASAVILLLAVDPWLARDAGFALSTLATLGLLLFARPWGAAWARTWPPALRPLGPLLAVPVAAQVCCAPVLVLLQGQLTLVGVLTNLLAGPLVAPATVLGVTGAALALVLPGVASWCAVAAGVPTTGIALIARWGADLPGGAISWPATGAAAAGLAVVLGLAVLAAPWLARKARDRPRRAVLACSLLLGATVPTAPLSWPSPTWRVVFCDVGQGDAAVLRTGDHSAVLVDAGPRPDLVDRCLRRLGVATLDAVVLTHFHADHVDGLPGALRGRAVRVLLTTSLEDPAYQAEEVARWARQAGIPERVLHDGDRLDTGWLRGEVWAPDRPVPGGSAPNNASIVLAVSVGPVDALLLGDVEREAGHDLLRRVRADPQRLTQAHRFDVVKSPHHGSANLDPDLLAEVRAPVAVVSVGTDNDYGHPAPSHLAVLRRNGYTVLRTDQRGDIAVCVEAGVVVVRTER